jgi:hypothetical protein
MLSLSFLMMLMLCLMVTVGDHRRELELWAPFCVGAGVCRIRSIDVLPVCINYLPNYYLIETRNGNITHVLLACFTAQLPADGSFRDIYIECGPVLSLCATEV